MAREALRVSLRYGEAVQIGARPGDGGRREASRGVAPCVAHARGIAEREPASGGKLGMEGREPGHGAQPRQTAHGRDPRDQRSTARMVQVAQIASMKGGEIMRFDPAGDIAVPPVRGGQARMGEVDGRISIDRFFEIDEPGLAVAVDEEVAGMGIGPHQNRREAGQALRILAGEALGPGDLLRQSRHHLRRGREHRDMARLAGDRLQDGGNRIPMHGQGCGGRGWWHSQRMEGCQRVGERG